MLTRRRGIAGFFKQHAGAQIVLYDLDNFAAFARPKHKYRAGGVPPSRLAAREKEYAAASEFIISHREPREQPSPPSQHLGNATRIELVPDWHPGAPERYGNGEGGKRECSNAAGDNAGRNGGRASHQNGQ